MLCLSRFALNRKNKVFSAMWMEKIRHGVLEVSTDQGVRYVHPGFLERARLVWMFRNFRVLPQEVLTPHQRRLVEALCSEQHLKPCRNGANGNGTGSRNGQSQPNDCIIGTLERLTLPGRKPNGRVTASPVSSSGHA
jgi:hypothetical protein